MYIYYKLVEDSISILTDKSRLYNVTLITVAREVKNLRWNDDDDDDVQSSANDNDEYSVPDCEACNVSGSSSRIYRDNVFLGHSRVYTRVYYTYLHTYQHLCDVTNDTKFPCYNVSF